MERLFSCLARDYPRDRQAIKEPQHLRLVTRDQNAQNLGVRSDNTTGIRGVTVTNYGAYRATVSRGGRRVYDKVFSSLTEAESAVIEARTEYMTHSVD